MKLDKGWKTDRELKKVACAIGYKNEKGKRGWWVREYHSPVAMTKWPEDYAETGPFDSEEEARKFALEPLSPDWGR